MRNLLGRLHARQLPELLRIAEFWGVLEQGESKSEIVSTLYRTLTDPRAIRDLWEAITPEERQVALVLADAPDDAEAPTLPILAAQADMSLMEARETALNLYRCGVLAREGDDDPLRVGEAPRLLMPREVALNIRRIQDEMAAGDLAQSPLRVLIELLDDAELEQAARIWGLSTLPGVARRPEVANRVLRLVNDPQRIDRVVAGRSRDASAIWRLVRAGDTPVPLPEIAAAVGIAAHAKGTARLRAALAELESALLVWHAYRPDGSRWLFVPREIRFPDQMPAVALPPLAAAVATTPPWRHPDAFAWDLLTVQRIISGARSPHWLLSDPAPRWLARAASRLLWYGQRDGVPPGYLELLQALGLAEGLLVADEATSPQRVIVGPAAKAWRQSTFPEWSSRLRERWLHLPRWTEGDPAGIVELWGADWRGMRPRLLEALADPEIALAEQDWVTVESLATRIAARYPALLGPSFTAATARLAGEIGAGPDEAEARAAALSDVISFELSGPFVWFGITSVADPPGQPRAIALREPTADEDGVVDGHAPLHVAASGEVSLTLPTPDRVWALSAFAEQVDLGVASHYRLTSRSIGAAIATGVTQERIVAFLERGSRTALPEELLGQIAAWAQAQRVVHLQRAISLQLDTPALREALLHRLQQETWQVERLGEQGLLVQLASPDADAEEQSLNLQEVLQRARFTPRWRGADDETAAVSECGESAEDHLE